jgi:DNA-binding transcriptional MerR regulator
VVVNKLSDRLRNQPPVKRFKIGEVAEYSGLSRQTVHNYTIMGLIREQGWTDGGHRFYDESVFSRLARIDELKNQRTLREIIKIFDQDQQKDYLQADRAELSSPSAS